MTGLVFSKQHQSLSDRPKTRTQVFSLSGDRQNVASKGTEAATATNIYLYYFNPKRSRQRLPQLGQLTKCIKVCEKTLKVNFVLDVPSWSLSLFSLFCCCSCELQPQFRPDLLHLPMNK